MNVSQSQVMFYWWEPWGWEHSVVSGHDNDDDREPPLVPVRPGRDARELFIYRGSVVIEGGGHQDDASCPH